jgi:microcystin-dependent protein
MAGMYPDNETLEVFGKTVSWPGVDKNGKFTNGSFSDPAVRPSFIPAQTVNLILDNLSELLSALGKTPNNESSDQLASAIIGALEEKTDVDSLVNRIYPVGTIYESVVNRNPAEFIGGTWTVWGAGRVSVGVDTSDTDFATVEKTGGSSSVTLTEAQMPSHTHTQDAHNHTQSSHNHMQNEHSHTQVTHNHIVHTYKSSSGQATSTRVGQAGFDSDYYGSNTTSVAPVINNATASNQPATASNVEKVATNQNKGGGGSHDNKMKYITSYKWKRTA